MTQKTTYTTTTRTDGPWSITEIRREGPEYPVAIGTDSPPFEEIEPYLSKRPLAKPGDKFDLPRG